MKTNHLLIIFVLLSTLLTNLATRVGLLRSESLSVDREDAKSVRVEIEFGAGTSMIDLIGKGPHTAEYSGLINDGDVYTNAAYRVSDVTMQIDMEAVLARSTWK